MDVGDERFRFYFDGASDEILHITRRHGITPEQAIRVFLDGDTTWDEAHTRFETVTATHTLYWARHASDGSVVVITCFAGRTQ